MRRLMILACALAIAAATLDVRCSASADGEVVLFCSDGGCRAGHNRPDQPAIVCSAAWRFGGVR